jgi:hypothetical protein
MTFPLMNKENFLDFSNVKEMLLSIKNEVDKLLNKMEAGHIQVGLEPDALKVKPKLQDIWHDGGGQKEVGPCILRKEMGFSFNKLNGLEGKRIGRKGDSNVGLSNTNIHVEAPSSSKNGEGPARKTEAVYQRQVKQTEMCFGK